MFLYNLYPVDKAGFVYTFMGHNIVSPQTRERTWK